MRYYMNCVYFVPDSVLLYLYLAMSTPDIPLPMDRTPQEAKDEDTDPCGLHPGAATQGRKAED